MAVLMNPFGMDQAHLGSFFPGEPEPGDSGHVLSEIEKHATLVQSAHLYRTVLFDIPYRDCLLCGYVPGRCTPVTDSMP